MIVGMVNNSEWTIHTHTQ